MENLKENFILLSKVAKEKKYAQEYLGLLARRGDIGSIRIGKRWYTTTEWFEEFLKNGQKKPSADKKEVVSEKPFVALTQTEPAKVSPPVFEKEEVKINVPFVFLERKEVSVAQPATQTQSEKNIFDEPAKVSVFVKTNPSGMPVQRNVAGDIRGIGGRREIKIRTVKAPIRDFVSEAKFGNTSVKERNKHAVPYREVKFRKKTGVFSPDFSGEEKMSAPIFGRLAFVFSFSAIVLLVAASGYFVYSGGLLARGKVAGASDERNTGLSGIKSESEYFLASATDKMKETMSISRVVVEAARERGLEE